MRNVLLVGLLLSFSSAFSQEDIFSGTVLDADTKEPLAFTNIGFVGKNVGTVTNVEGAFILSVSNLTASDSISFSYVGYETLKVSVSELRNTSTVYLNAAVINLKEVKVFAGTLSAKDIIALVVENFDENHSTTTSKQKVFFHKYEKVPFTDANQLNMKKSNFVGIDQAVLDEFFQLMPDEFIEYQDAIVDLYSMDDSRKLVPIQGISLEEGSQKELFNEMENMLEDFLADIEKSKEDPDIYYKFKTGIFSQKMDDLDSSEESEPEIDDINYTLPSSQIRGEITSMIADYADVESKNWEFVNKHRKYKYLIENITPINDENAYEISFLPKNGGLFEGRIFISTDNYAVLRLDFAYAEGKQNEKIQLLGVGHAMNYKEGKVIFEKGIDGYFVKYIYAEQQESFSVERNFSILKKRKRTLFDKELNEFKIEAQLFFDSESFREILVLNHEDITNSEYENAVQPAKMKFKREFAYTPEMWNNRTVLVPTAALKEYKRVK